MFEPHYYSKTMNHQTSLPLEANSIELYTPNLTTPLSNMENKEKEPFCRYVKIFQGPEAVLAHNQLYQSWEIAAPILNYEETITTATPLSSDSSWCILPIYTMMTCPVISDKMSVSHSNPYSICHKPMPLHQNTGKKVYSKEA